MSSVITIPSTGSSREFSGYTTTVTSATPIDLTSASTFVQRYTGSTSQAVKMPVTTTLSAKFAFLFVNDSSATLTIATSNGSLINTIGPGGYALVVCILASGTTAASWKFIPIPLIDIDGTLAANSDVIVPSQMAVVTYVATQIALALATSTPRFLFYNTDDVGSSHTSGAEDDLRSYEIGALLLNPGDSIIQEEVVQTVGSATASRRIRKYIRDSNNNILFDSGALTLSIGATFILRTTIVRIDDTSVRVDVLVTSTSASTVPYAVFTEILTLDGLSASSEVLTTSVIASGVGAAGDDIVSKMVTVQRIFGPP